MESPLFHILAPAKAADKGPAEAAAALLAEEAQRHGCRVVPHSSLSGLLESSLDGVIGICEAPGLGAADIIARLRQCEIWQPVIAAGLAPEVPQVVAAIRAGAADYLPLPAGPSCLARALRSASEQMRRLARMRREEVAHRKVASLTRRERQVLDLLSEGATNKEIARALAISPRTVEIHRTNMMRKLAAGHAAEAVRISIEAEHSAQAQMKAIFGPMPLRRVRDANLT